MSIELRTINRLMRIIGLQLIVCSWDGDGPWQPTRFEVITKKTWALRAGETL